MLDIVIFHVLKDQNAFTMEYMLIIITHFDCQDFPQLGVNINFEDYQKWSQIRHCTNAHIPKCERVQRENALLMMSANYHDPHITITPPNKVAKKEQGNESRTNWELPFIGGSSLISECLQN